LTRREHPKAGAPRAPAFEAFNLDPPPTSAPVDLKPDECTTRETRTSFVSILSDGGVPLEEISRLVGHSGTTVTEKVYRKQIRPVIQTGAVAMDGIFGSPPPPAR
jgi:integrase